MALDVKVKISLTKPTGKLEFGYPLIVAVGTTAIPYTECRSLDDVVTAGYDVTSDTYNAAALMFEQNNPPKKIAVCTMAGTVVEGLPAIISESWRQLVTVSLGTSETAADVVTYIETTDYKMYFATVEDVTGLAALGNGDRTIGLVHNNPLAAAALAGEAAGRAAGSFTYKNLILKGIDPMTLTDTEIDAIHKANGFTFVTKAGDNVTTEGTVMSGEYIDIIDCKDYIIQQLEYKTQKLLNTSAKIPYDNNGIAMLESVALDVLLDAYGQGMIATDDSGKPAYSVSYTLAEDVETDDKIARKYLGGKFGFTLTGAIHYVEINGEISLD